MVASGGDEPIRVGEGARSRRGETRGARATCNASRHGEDDARGGGLGRPAAVLGRTGRWAAQVSPSKLSLSVF